VKYVLLYESSADVAEKAPLHFAAHRARWKEFHDKGTLLLIGPFSDQLGALGVFTTREAAEEFASGDPFVLEGVVKAWQIREWREALVGN
jgi:uncharacterized protein YciI